MEKTLAAQIDQFNSDVKQAAEEVVFSTFPKKILELQQLILTTSKPDSPFNPNAATGTDTRVYPPPSDSDVDLPSKKRKTSQDEDNGSESLSASALNDIHYARLPNLVLSNKHVKHLHSVIKEECKELAASIDKVRLWVSLTMPRIEDGDNFGVQVQEEVLNELHRAQDSAYNISDHARVHYLARAKICSKLIKYPNVEDYTFALQEHDEKQIYKARQHLYDIRNLYAVLTDVIQKNITKIRAPKANNSSGLY